MARASASRRASSSSSGCQLIRRRAPLRGGDLTTGAWARGDPTLPAPHDIAGLIAWATPDLLLAQAAFLVTNLWLYAALKAARGRDRPELVNSDGEPLEFATLHFPLLPGATPQRVRQALATIPIPRPENASFWNWLAEPGTKPQKVPRRAKGQTFITTMEDGSLVLGTVELKGRRLSLEANSVARGARARAAGAGAGRPGGRALVHQGLEDHYRRVLDEPIPALGRKSPRAAAKTPKGREKLAAWLKTLENHMARQDPDSPMGGYDVGWMWRELGVEALRR